MPAVGAHVRHAIAAKLDVVEAVVGRDLPGRVLQGQRSKIDRAEGDVAANGTALHVDGRDVLRNGDDELHRPVLPCDVAARRQNAGHQRHRDDRDDFRRLSHIPLQLTYETRTMRGVMKISSSSWVLLMLWLRNSAPTNGSCPRTGSRVLASFSRVW